MISKLPIRGTLLACGPCEPVIVGVEDALELLRLDWMQASLTRALDHPEELREILDIERNPGPRLADLRPRSKLELQ